jgi:hypothetical protein
MQLAVRLALLLMLTLTAAACASGRAQVIEDKPTLSVPPVPPRTIEVPPPVDPPVAEPVVEPVAALPAAPKPKPNRPAAESKPVETKPETGADPPGTATTPTPPPVAQLRTPTTPSGPEATRLIQETLRRADAILSRVDYQRLSDDKRANYNAAKGWMQQAEEMIRKDDLRQAQNFADRAENVAKQLDSR